MAEHLIGRDAPAHRRWDVDAEPILHVNPGEMNVVEWSRVSAGFSVPFGWDLAIRSSLADSIRQY
jgi:hypothetical protein